MESLIINQKKLAATAFAAFSDALHIAIGIDYELTDSDFVWTKNKVEWKFTRWSEKAESLNFGDLLALFGEQFRAFNYDLQRRDETGQYRKTREDGVDPQGKVQQKKYVTDVIGRYSDLTTVHAKMCVAANPLIELLKSDYHPHASAIVTNNSVEIVEGILGVPDIAARDMEAQNR